MNVLYGFGVYSSWTEKGKPEEKLAHKCMGEKVVTPKNDRKAEFNGEKG